MNTIVISLRLKASTNPSRTTRVIGGKKENIECKLQGGPARGDIASGYSFAPATPALVS